MPPTKLTKFVLSKHKYFLLLEDTSVVMLHGIFCCVAPQVTKPDLLATVVMESVTLWSTPCNKSS